MAKKVVKKKTLVKKKAAKQNPVEKKVVKKKVFKKLFLKEKAAQEQSRPTIQVKHDDDHTQDVVDNAAKAYLQLFTHRLNKALKTHGVDDAATRQAICDEVVVEEAYHWDFCWFSQESPSYYPKVCFLERADPGPYEDLGAIRVVHLSTEASEWHKLAPEVMAKYFETETLGPDIHLGAYGTELGDL